MLSDRTLRYAWWIARRSAPGRRAGFLRYLYGRMHSPQSVALCGA